MSFFNYKILMKNSNRQIARCASSTVFQNRFNWYYLIIYIVGTHPARVNGDIFLSKNIFPIAYYVLIQFFKIWVFLDSLLIQIYTRMYMKYCQLCYRCNKLSVFFSEGERWLDLTWLPFTLHLLHHFRNSIRLFCRLMQQNLIRDLNVMVDG